MDRLYELADGFRRSLKPRHEEEFEIATSGDMRKEIRDIQSLRDNTHNMMDMNRLRMFLDGMEELERVLLYLGFPGTKGVMSLIWGSITFFLKVSNTSDKAFNGMLKVYGLLGAQLLPLTQFQQLFQGFPDAIECIVNIYHDVQRFHSTAYRLFSLTSKLWHNLQKPVWDDANDLFSTLSHSLGSHAKFIKEHSSTQDYRAPREAFQKYSLGIESDWDDFEMKEKARKNKRRQETMEWITPSAKMPRLQKEFRDMAICPNSGRWLFRNYSAISEWMGEEDPPHSAIWLHGNVGCGKTVLASLIVDELKSSKLQNTMPSFPDGSKTCYFYCREDNSELRNHLDILKGILLQMVEAEDYIIPLCYQEKATSSGSNPIDAERAQKLIKTFIEFSTRHYIVIDGMDECDGVEIQQTAKFFKDLVSTYDTQIKLGHLRVLFIGRETLDTKKHIPGDDCIGITLRPEDNHDDIKAFVQKRLPEFSKSTHSIGFSLSEADKSDVERIICRQSQDSFLYANLAIELLLQQDTKGGLLTLLRESGGMIPKELGNIYERLLECVRNRLAKLAGGNERWEKSKLLFGWLICAKRPLRWHEMQAITCFNPEQLKIDFENNMLRHDMEKYLGSIVRVLDGGHIHLIHSTARRYIIDNKHISEKQVQCQLTTICLRYLTLPCFTGDGSYTSHQRSHDAKLGWFSFQDYACSQWFCHLDVLIRDCSEVFTTGRFLKVAADFASALKHFVDTHRADLTSAKHTDLVEDHLVKFINLQLYQDLHLVWNHIYTHQRGDYATLNTIGMKQIENGLKHNRMELERFLPGQRSGDEDTIEDYYGSKLFKCNRTLCPFFHIGYKVKGDRDQHGKRHEKPFQCPVFCNAAPFGFSSNKDRERHVNTYHQDLREGGAIFEALSRRQVPGRFSCEICGKTFTRNINLKAHKRSHFGDRPYACNTCHKTFVRVNDCRRHEKIHEKNGY
ncbi:early growth response 1-B [Fusarium subglutinans]|uniref:Early growth response 1-B n=1 Tax=Gibberella subglutinans TaxID=42677 RepID=A0A8H5NTU9_GIBSU|nr:early growth response 1-B [Fusarium subglutinans]KAF5575695.1 early growth response 1-B [Fusarium subglutinans]